MGNAIFKGLYIQYDATFKRLPVRNNATFKVLKVVIVHCAASSICQRGYRCKRCLAALPRARDVDDSPIAQGLGDIR
jgi:uncharacterized metal-binding protein